MEIVAEEEARTETEVEETETAEAESTLSVKPEIAFPLEGHTANSLKNLVNTIYSRGRLMSKATGGDFRVSDKLVEELKEYGTTAEEVLRIIRSAGEDWLNGLKFEEDKVVFTGFPATEDSVKTRAYMLLAAAINQSSLEQKHIQAKKVDESNEEFKLCNETWTENAQVVKLHIMCGSTQDGIMRQHIYKNGVFHDVSIGSILAEEWFARRVNAKYDRFNFE